MSEVLTAQRKTIAPQHIATVDSLRGIAAIVVLLAHSHIFYDHTPVGDPSLGAVLLFFLISGFCIVMSLDSLGTQKTRAFLIRRAFRLYPTYWLSIVFTILASAELFPIADTLINLTMFQAFVNVKNINPVYWTLFYELLFYGLVAFLLKFGFKQNLIVYGRVCIGLALCALIASILRYFTGLSIPRGPFLLISMFFAGGSFCMFLREKRPIYLAWLFAVAYLMVILLISWLIFGEHDIAYESGNGIYYKTAMNYFGGYLFAIAIFLVAINNNWFAWRWLSSLGGVSYAVYLLHVPVMLILLKYMIEGIAFTALALFITIILSYLITNLVERPMTKMGRLITAPEATVQSHSK